MIIGQKYHSGQEIDPEFIPGLEQLLMAEVPSFEWLLASEKRSPVDYYYNYHLFFAQETNAPIGLAVIEMTPIVEQESWWKKTFTRTRKNKIGNKNKNASLKLPGSPHCGLYFNPRYKDQSLAVINQLLEDFYFRADIKGMRWSLPLGLEKSDRIFQAKNIKKQNTLSSLYLVKNSLNYQDYLINLPLSRTKEINDFWQRISEEEYFFSEYSDLKEVFRYKKKARQLYQEAKKMPKLQMASDIENKTILTLEKEDRPLAIVIIYPGQGGHFFYDAISFGTILPSWVLQQMAIMKFYEIENANWLHCLSDSHQAIDQMNEIQSLEYSLKKA